MPSSTTGWGGGRAGHISGTQRIPSLGTSEVTWYQEGATRDWKPSPLPYQTRNVLYVFREEPESAAVLGIPIVF